MWDILSGRRDSTKEERQPAVKMTTRLPLEFSLELPAYIGQKLLSFQISSRSSWSTSARNVR